MENCFFPDFSGTHSWRRVCVCICFKAWTDQWSFTRSNMAHWWVSSRCLNVSIWFLCSWFRTYSRGVAQLLTRNGSIDYFSIIGIPEVADYGWYTVHTLLVGVWPSIENPKSGNITYIILYCLLALMFFRKSMSTGPLFDGAGAIARRQRGHGALRENGHTGGGPASTSREQRGSFHLRGGCFLRWWD